MSQSQREAWKQKFFSKGAKGQSLLKRVKEHVKHDRDGDAGVPSDTHLSYPVLTRDLAPTFQTLGLVNIVPPKSCVVAIVVDVTGEDADRMLADGSLVGMMQRKTEEAVTLLTKQLADALKVADPAATSEEKRDFVNKTILSQVDWLKVKTEAVIEESIRNERVYLERDKKRLKKWKLKCRLSIGLGVVVIAGSIAVTGLTWGAAAPAAVVGIARSCVTVGQTCFALVAGINKVAGLVRYQLGGLQKIMMAREKGQSDEEYAASKRGNSAKNVLLGVVSGVTGDKMATPTIDNCETHIETYAMKVTELEVKRDESGPLVYQMMDAVTLVERQAASLPDGTEERKLADKFVAESQNELNALLVFVEKTTAAVLEGRKNREDWTAALEELEVHGWTNHVAALVGGATDLALGVGGAMPDPLMAGLAALTSLEASCADKLIEKI